MSKQFLYALLMLVTASFLSYAVRNPPVNHAATAKITADSEHSEAYKAAGVADGVIPKLQSQNDVGQAWAVDGATYGGDAQILFQWREAVTVKEIIYFGRTAFFVEECWKDYALYLDNEDLPVVTGTFRQTDTPQRIKLPKKVKVRKLRLKFISSYGGANPGASEILVLESSPSKKELEAYQNPVKPMPWHTSPDREALQRLIRQLAVPQDDRTERVGVRHWYAQLPPDVDRDAEKHLRATRGPESRLPALQREVLLAGVDRLLAIKRHEITASHVYTYHYEGFRAGGGLYTADPRAEDLDLVELVASPTGQILDADLSYDGTTALFSWRMTEDDGYHLWTINVDGTGLTQLTDGPWHDYNPCWLPDGGIAFLSTRKPQFAYCWHAPVGIVHRMNADGTDIQCLSANYLNDFTPYVLEDGRILYSRWEYVDRPAIPIQSLWTLNPDGTGLSAFFGNRVLSPGTFMEARSIPGTEKVICTMTGHNGPTRGAIGILDRRRGINAQEAITNITPDTPVPNVDQGNGNTDGGKYYSCPFPLDAERFLVSAQGPIIARTYSGDCQSVVLPAPDNGMQWFNAQPIRPRKRPPAIAPLPETKEKDAVVYLKDIYEGLGPQVQPGEIKRLRVVREMEKTVRIDPDKRAFGFQFPVISCGATYAGKDVIGEVPVEEDGSAYFRVPAGIPVYFMALDEHGRAVQRMRSFTHFMPGERQGCIGCHESRTSTTAPDRGMALKQEPRILEPPEWGRGGFGYTQIVQPVLDQHCVRCHDAIDPPKGLDLTGDTTDYFNVSYEHLARDPQGPEGSPYVKWIPTYNGQEQNILKIAPKTWGSPSSKLAEVIFSGHPDANGKPRIHLDEESKRRLYAWMDLNVPYYDSSETAYPDNVGCRQLYPEQLDAVLTEVIARRCVACHEDGKIPRKVWTRVTNPHLNNFLTAPLSKLAGGTERCGEDVFASTEDVDYQAILTTFDPVLAQLKTTPRMDMPGAKPAPNVCRDSK